MADEIQRLWIDPPTPIRMAAGVGNVYSVTRYCDPGNGARMPPDSEGVSGLVGMFMESSFYRHRVPC
jgi:hypothetical protein